MLLLHSLETKTMLMVNNKISLSNIGKKVEKDNRYEKRYWSKLFLFCVLAKF